MQRDPALTGRAWPPFVCSGELPVGARSVTVTSAEGRHATVHLDLGAPDCCGCVVASSEVVDFRPDAGGVGGGGVDSGAVDGG